MIPGRFITVSNTQYCTYFTQIDIVTDKDKHTYARHISIVAWLAIVKSSLILRCNVFNLQGKETMFFSKGFLNYCF